MGIKLFISCEAPESIYIIKLTHARKPGVLQSMGSQRAGMTEQLN